MRSSTQCVVDCFCLLFRHSGCKAAALKLDRCARHLVEAHERGELDLGKPRKSRKSRKPATTRRAPTPPSPVEDSDDEFDLGSIKRPPTTRKNLTPTTNTRPTSSRRREPEVRTVRLSEDPPRPRLRDTELCSTPKCKNAAAYEKNGFCITCYNLLLTKNTRDPKTRDMIAEMKAPKPTHQSSKPRTASQSRLRTKDRHSRTGQHHEHKHSCYCNSRSVERIPTFHCPDCSARFRGDCYCCHCACSAPRHSCRAPVLTHGCGCMIACDGGLSSTNSSSALSTDSNVFSLEDFEDVSPLNWEVT